MITDLISNFILWVDSIFNNIGLYSALPASGQSHLPSAPGQTANVPSTAETL